MISVIIPAYNEAHGINELIAHVRGLVGGDAAEIVVVDGTEEGSTISAIQCGDVISATSSKGRARQMNSGASLARGRVLLFLHADTRLPLRAFPLIIETLEDRAVAGGAFDLAIGSDGAAFRVIERVASLRSRATRIPYGDQAIFVRREFFMRIGGYADIPLMEDVELMRRIKKRGDRIVILPDRVITSPRRWQQEGIVYCTLRNWLLITLYLIGVAPGKLARLYK